MRRPGLARRATALVVMALGALLAACTGPAVQVTRFHSLPAKPGGETVELRAVDPDKSDSLEFRHYAELAANALAQAGYPPPKPGNPPDLIARLGWKVDNGRMQLSSMPVYSYIGTGVFVRRVGADGRTSAVFVPPPYGVVDTAVSSRTIYDVVVTLDVASAKAGSPPKFEGRASTVALTPDIAPIMPLMLKALFANFPGTSGATELVRPEDEAATEQKK